MTTVARSAIALPRARTGRSPEPSWLGAMLGFFTLMEEVFREARADARAAYRRWPFVEW